MVVLPLLTQDGEESDDIAAAERLYLWPFGSGESNGAVDPMGSEESMMVWFSNVDVGSAVIDPDR